jgi:hypothetical protein
MGVVAGEDEWGMVRIPKIIRTQSGNMLYGRLLGLKPTARELQFIEAELNRRGIEFNKDPIEPEPREIRSRPGHTGVAPIKIGLQHLERLTIITEPVSTRVESNTQPTTPRSTVNLIEIRPRKSANSSIKPSTALRITSHPESVSERSY